MIALEGDGSILMALGCLTTIANVKPRNLTIIIWDNGLYQITGKQPTATSGRDRHRRGRARRRHRQQPLGARRGAFRRLIDRRFDDGGPVLIAAKIDDQPAAGPAPRDPALIRNRFMKGWHPAAAECWTLKAGEFHKNAPGSAHSRESVDPAIPAISLLIPAFRGN